MTLIFEPRADMSGCERGVDRLGRLARVGCAGDRASDDEMIDKMKYYAANDSARIAMARTGCERIHDYFMVDKICQYMIETVFDVPFSMSYRWPTRAY